MNVKIRLTTLDFGSDFEIGCAWQIGMDAALHAHFRGTGVPGFGGPIADLLQREGVRVGIGAPLGERAEPAAGVADVGEVDVAGDHVGDVVPVDLAAQPVGDPGQFLQVRAVGGEEGDGLGVGEGGRVTFGLPERGSDFAAGQDGGSAGSGRGGSPGGSGVGGGSPRGSGARGGGVGGGSPRGSGAGGGGARGGGAGGGCARGRSAGGGDRGGEAAPFG